MKVLESFLIALGIKVDDKSFQAADAAFGGLTRSALQLGAVLAGKLAIDKVVGDFKQVGTELNNFNKLTGMSTQNVQMLGQAIKAQGGSAADAFADLTKLQDLMASPITGNTGWFGEVAKLGLDPNVIIGAKGTAEALTNIAKEFEHMTPLNQRLAGNALGLSESTVRLLMKGSEEAQKQLDVRGKFAVMTQKQIEDSARLTKAASELDLVFTDMGNTIAGELVPAFAEMAEDFVEFYRNNRDLIDSGLKEFFGGLADNIELVSVALALMGGSAALKGLSALKSIAGLGAAAGGAGAARTAAAAAGGASLLRVAGGTAAALFYSSKLNDNEDNDLLSNRLKKGGSEAAGATIDYFRQKGWSTEQAMGIAANLQQESGFRPDAEGDGGQAYGLAQWHKDRQSDFAKYSGKDIRQSTASDQLDFIHYELTKGKEKAAGNALRTASTAYEAGGIVSSQYERPKDQLGEAERRGALAQSYGGSPAPASETAASVPVIDLSDPDTWARIQKELGRTEKPQPSVFSGIEQWIESHRKPPKAYAASDVVTPPTQQPTASQLPQVSTAQPAQNIDQRQYHIHGADTEKVRQLLNEQMSQMTEQTTQDFRSPER